MRPFTHQSSHSAEVAASTSYSLNLTWYEFKILEWEDSNDSNQTLALIACARISVTADGRKKWARSETANERKTAGREKERSLLRLSPAPTRFSRNFSRSAFSTILASGTGYFPYGTAYS